MAIQSGTAALYNQPPNYRWEAYNRDGKIYAILYSQDDTTQKIIDCAPGWDCYKSAPAIRATPIDPNAVNPNQRAIDVFFATADSRLAIARITFDYTPGEAPSNPSSQVTKLRYDQDGNGSYSKLPTTGVSVSPIDGGVVTITRNAAKNKNLLCFFSNEDLADLGTTVVASQAHELETPDESLNLDRTMGTIINGVQTLANNEGYAATNMLVLGIKATSGDPGIYAVEYYLGNDQGDAFAPSLLGSRTELLTADISSIATNRPKVQTAVDGRVYISFYQDDDGDATVTQFVRHGTGDHGEDRTWRQVKHVFPGVADLSNVAMWTSPGLAYRSEQSNDEIQTQRELENLTTQVFPVTRSCSVVYGSGGLSLQTDSFGHLRREALPVVSAMVMPPVLLGVVRGAPPMSNTIITQNPGRAGYQKSSVKIVQSESVLAETEVSAQFGASLNVGGAVSWGVGVEEIAGTKKTLSFSIALGAMFSSVYQQMDRMSSELTIDTAQYPLDPMGGGYFVPPWGYAYFMLAGLAGYAYYFVDESTSDYDSDNTLPNLPIDATVLYEYSSVRKEYVALPFDIRPDCEWNGIPAAVPGDLGAYAETARYTALSEQPQLSFASSQGSPQVGWVIGNASATTVDYEFAHNDRNVSRHSISIDAAMRFAWKTRVKSNIGALEASAYGEVGVSFAYAQQSASETASTFTLESNLDMRAATGPGQPIPSSYTSQIFMVKAEDFSTQSQEMISSWVAELEANDTPFNAIILGLVKHKDPEAAGSRIDSSNPFFIDYAVTSITPTGYQEQVETPFDLFVEQERAWLEAHAGSPQAEGATRVFGLRDAVELHRRLKS
ncbi:hypothetical protein PPSIR1_00630 [Plesiocystis pacifica SIR-1]|uniref:Uncharacterized protein n=1 Tax=Plesiocystis pacifica SIR-1 TaxID=391625 RepID=A6G7I4_9BACT|nr:hypothetical protein [Plesiocystis pacifica]EDM78193.1 hypothetical protein PPSIR1_00630 [Plesiocystis pacifica SIR-1]